MTRSCWMFGMDLGSPNKIKVVLPVCDRDKALLYENLRWQYELDGIKNFDGMLAADASISEQWISLLEHEASRTFITLQKFLIPTPPQQKWPEAPNIMFQTVAREMERQGRSWFWMEPDCVPICPGWLDSINAEYLRCGKPIMGSIVEGMGHCNGTAIYPPNFPRLSRRAMRCTDSAWDGEMKKETISKTHNAVHLMCHVWGELNGRPQPFGGNPIQFNSWRDVEKFVDLRAVTYHRSKNESLIHQLRGKASECPHPDR